MSTTVVKLPAELTKHVVLLKEGVLNYDDKKGSLSSTTQEFNDVFAAFEASGKKKLVLDFHGGLVDEAGAREGSAALVGHYTKQNSYPVFVHWDSDFVSVFERNWCDFLLDVGHHAILDRIIKFVSGKVGPKWETFADTSVTNFSMSGTVPIALTDAAAIARLSDSAAMQAFEDELKAEFESTRSNVTLEDVFHGVAASPHADDTGIKAAARSITVAMLKESKLPRTTLKHNDFGTDGPVMGFGFNLPGAAMSFAKWVVELALAVKARWDDKKWHGFHATLVEELAYKAGAFGYNLDDFGKFTWGSMKKDIAKSFGPSPNHGASAILRKLRARIDSGKPTEVLLLGHSAGAIYICEFLKAAKKELAGAAHPFKFDVVFYAPACTFKTFTEAWDETADDLVNDFRMFTMYDEQEKKDILTDGMLRDWVKKHNVKVPDGLVKAVEGWYPHSLLYLISGVLEDEKDKALVGMERFYDPTKGAAAATYPEVLAGVKHINGRHVWSITDKGNAGKLSSATKHGGFPSNVLTRQSTEHIIEHGWA